LRLHCHEVVRWLTSSSRLFMFLLSRGSEVDVTLLYLRVIKTGRLRIIAC
jgi:hypothetical protein